MAVKFLTREEASASGEREDRLLLEQTPGHYPEFEAFLRREIGSAGGDLFFAGPSGAVFRAGFVREAGDDGLIGFEICLREEAMERTLSAEIINADLWEFIEWILDGVGGEWSSAEFREIGAIYHIPGAPSSPDDGLRS